MTRLLIAALLASLSTPALAVEPGRFAPPEVAEMSPGAMATAREAVDVLGLAGALDRFQQAVEAAVRISPASGSPDAGNAAPARAAIEQVYREEIDRSFREHRPILDLMITQIMTETFSPIELQAIVDGIRNARREPAQRRGLGQHLESRLREAERTIGESLAAWWLEEMPLVLERADERLRQSGFAVNPR